MKTTIIYPASETRHRMISQGINPERAKRILEGSLAQQKEAFENLSNVLTKDDRLDLELDIVQTELMLLIVGRACFLLCAGVFPQTFF